MKLLRNIIACICALCLGCLCSCDIVFLNRTENSSQITLSDVTTTSDSASNQQQNQYPNAILPDQYYGWSLLRQEGSEAEKKAYQQLVSQIGSFKNSVTFDFDLTKAEFENAYGLYKQDYPEHFWRGGEYTLSSKGDKVTKVVFKNTLFGGDVDKIKTAKSKIDASVGEILSKLNDSMSDFEKEIAIHNYLINRTKYMDGESSHTIVGVFVDGRAVCQGYSLAFQYLIRLAGVQCITVTGKFNNQSHMWNMIKLDGEFYHIDVTADDPIVDNGEEVVDFNYFNLNDRQIKIDHTITNKEFTPPTANSNEYEFFTKTGQLYSEFSVDSFAQSMVYACKHGYKYAYMRFEKADISNAAEHIKNNYYAIIDRANEVLGSKKIKRDTKINIIYGEERGIVNLQINY